MQKKDKEGKNERHKHESKVGTEIERPIKEVSDQGRSHSVGIHPAPISKIQREEERSASKIPDISDPARRVWFAGSLVAKAIKNGTLKRPLNCENCKTDLVIIEACHYDYDLPLKVRWLCRTCHMRWDRDVPKNSGFAGKYVKRVSTSRPISIRVDEALLNELKAEAEKSNRKLAGYVNHLLASRPKPPKSPK